MSIVVSGSLVYDYIMNFPDSFRNHILPEQLHILSVSFVVNKLERGFGGTAGNIAYSIALLGGEPELVSVLGKDAEPYLAHLRKAGVATGNILVNNEQMTASAHITTDQDDNQITAFYPGPLADALTVDASKLTGTIALISPTDKTVMTKHLHAAADAGKTVIFDPGQQTTAFSGEELAKLIGRADFVIGNDYEMKLIEERSGLTAEAILKNDTTIITTLGGRGSIISTPDGKTLEIGSCPATSVDDPTGAGDAYRAGFVVGLEKDFSLETCAKMGSVAATYAIEHYGTQQHVFTKQEFVERYHAAFGEWIEL